MVDVVLKAVGTVEAMSGITGGAKERICYFA